MIKRIPETMENNPLNQENCYSIDRNQALQIVAHEVYEKNYDKANEMLGIIERSIKEDKKKMVTTNSVRLLNGKEADLFQIDDRDKN